MHSYLKQSTASQTRIIGPFLDDTDGKTAETGLSIANTDIKLSANGGTAANKNSGGGTHRANGNYAVTFDATDTATVGELHVSCKMSGALQVVATYTVLEESIYDSLFGASAAGFDSNGRVDVGALGGAAQSLTDLKDFADAGYDPATNKVQGVVLVDTCTTNTDMRGTDSALLASSAPANFGDLAITATTGRVDVAAIEGTTATSQLASSAATGAAAALNAYDPPTNTEMVAAFTEIKGGTWSSSTDTLEAIRDRGDSAWITATGFSTLDAAGIRTAVGLASANLDTQLGNIVADTNELQLDWEDGGRLDVNLDTVKTAVSAGAIANSVWNESVSSHTTAGTFGAKNQRVVPSETIADYRATGFSTHSATDVWAAGTRTLTAGTNLSFSTFDPSTDEIESGVTYLQGLRAACAALAGILAGANGSTITIKAIGAAADGTTRITATVDADGNRSAVTLNL